MSGFECACMHVRMRECMWMTAYMCHHLCVSTCESTCVYGCARGKPSLSHAPSSVRVGLVLSEVHKGGNRGSERSSHFLMAAQRGRGGAWAELLWHLCHDHHALLPSGFGRRLGTAQGNMTVLPWEEMVRLSEMETPC